jgi:glycosyltransferase involved in cell wall biosynthesis
MLPYQPRESLVESIAAGDALLVTLAEGLAGLSVPSKTYPILAAGRPVLYVGDRRSAIARLVADHGLGEVITAGDGKALADVIINWSKNKERVRSLGRAARRVFEARFDRQIAVDAYLKSFEACLKDSRTSKLIHPSAEAIATRRPKL